MKTVQIAHISASLAVCALAASFVFPPVSWASAPGSQVIEYPARTLSEFAKLITDVFSEVRSSNVSASSISTNDTSNVQTPEEQPVVEESKLDESKVSVTDQKSDSFDLSTKLAQSKNAIVSIYADQQYLESGSLALASKWNKLTDADIATTINDFKQRLGSIDSEKLSDNLFGQVNWISSSWNWSINPKVSTNLKASEEALLALEDNFNKNGKASTTYNSVKSFNKSLSLLDKLIGSSLDDKTDQTLFGNLSYIEDYSKELSSEKQLLDHLAGGWTGLNTEEKLLAIKSNNEKVLTLNKILGIKSILTIPVNLSTSSDSEMLNQVLAMRGIVIANQQLISQDPDMFLNSTWYELGNMEVKMLISNPSVSTSDVEVKYYLPKEVKQENILSVPEGLSSQQDSENEPYYVSGKFKLAPQETRLLSISLEDVWSISDGYLNNLSEQALTLSKSLENSAYFAESVSLTGEIQSKIDEINVSQKTVFLPEEKISAYRQNQVNIEVINTNINKLKDLTVTLTNNKSIELNPEITIGIIAAAAGIAFLVLFMTIAKVKGHLKLAAQVASYVILGVAVCLSTVLIMQNRDSITKMLSSQLGQKDKSISMLQVNNADFAR